MSLNPVITKIGRQPSELGVQRFFFAVGDAIQRESYRLRDKETGTLVDLSAWTPLTVDFVDSEGEVVLSIDDSGGGIAFTQNGEVVQLNLSTSDTGELTEGQVYTGVLTSTGGPIGTFRHIKYELRPVTYE